MTAFVSSLGTDDEVVVTPFDGEQIIFDASCVETLRQLDSAQRAELGDQLPPLNQMAAEWAAAQLYQACQLLVCRDVASEVVSRTLAQPCPVPRNESVDYSVDLFFRFLPDLLTVARRLAPADPLTNALLEWAKTWPLSSVGVSAGTELATGAFSGNSALMRLYADRVVERRASDRLNDLQLRKVLRADAGLFPELIPFPSSSYAND